MGTRPDVDAVGVPAKQVGGRREPLHVLGLKRRLLVGGRQLGIGVRPRLPLEGLSAPILYVSRGHTRSPPPGGRSG